MMMRPDRFTEQAQEILAASQQLVQEYRHSQWDVEHLLLALLRYEGDLVADIFTQMGVDVAALVGDINVASDVINLQAIARGAADQAVVVVNINEERDPIDVHAVNAAGDKAVGIVDQDKA